MKPNLAQVYLSSIDEDRFGMRTARAPSVTMDTFPSVMDFCRTNDVILLIARTLTSELEVVQAMERAGFLLMDTLVYYARYVTEEPIPSDPGQVPVRPVRPGEDEAVRLVAAESFRGYYGHYHADERLDRTRCDEVYTSWAFCSCVSREVADEVLVADLDGSVVGFVTLRLNTPEEGEALVGGIAPSAQRRGVYQSFIINGMQWCRAKGATRMIVSTQITNIAVQKVWARLGFEFDHAYYTLHKWFDQ